jgi:hypothetical protein
MEDYVSLADEARKITLDRAFYGALRVLLIEHNLPHLHFRKMFLVKRETYQQLLKMYRDRHAVFDEGKVKAARLAAACA